MNDIGRGKAAAFSCCIQMASVSAPADYSASQDAGYAIRRISATVGAEGGTVTDDIRIENDKIGIGPGLNPSFSA